MILVTGGLGFIGSHTTQALLDRGEGCVLLQRRTAELPAGWDGAQVVAERGDVTDLASLRAIGERHPITGIVHLAGSMPWPPDPDQPVEAARTALGLVNSIGIGTVVVVVGFLSTTVHFFVFTSCTT